MFPQVENLPGYDLPYGTELLLQRMFHDYERVVLKRDFSELAYSGSWVYQVHLIKEHRIPTLPLVVKIASASLIEEEWQAYQRCVHNQWPSIAELYGYPVFLEGQDLAGLCYSLVGAGVFDVKSLRQYCIETNEVEDIIFVLKERLFHILKERVLLPSTKEFEYPIQASYDRVLPVNLLVKPISLSNKAYSPYLITPERLPSFPLELGTIVCLTGFVVSKVDLRNQTLTLNCPKETRRQQYRLRVQMDENLSNYHAGDSIPTLLGEVIETRQTCLHTEVRKVMGVDFDPDSEVIKLPDGTVLPNPLSTMSRILEKNRHLKFYCIHGDLNLENILVDPQVRDIRLIDFAEARKDHVLHDFLHLETEVVTKLLPLTFSKANLRPEYIYTFYQRLHQVLFTKPHKGDFYRSNDNKELRKPLNILYALRQVVREGSYDPDDVSEYYECLILYLLGALRFKNLDANPLAKQLAFWGAAAIQKLLNEKVVHYRIRSTDNTRTPYVGLRPFQEDDAEFFLGRDNLKDLLLQKVKEEAFIAVIGSSGSGKSSLILSGLLPELKNRGLSKGESWYYVVMKPGKRPLNELARALHQLLGGHPNKVLELQKIIALGKPDLPNIISSQVEEARKINSHFILVIDQFEELWTLQTSEAKSNMVFAKQEQEAFIRLILSNTASSSLTVIISMRADFFHCAIDNPQLAEVIHAQGIIVSSMHPEELRQVIELPAKRCGVEFESGLVEELVLQVKGRPGALPLLEYTLLELWKKRSGEEISWDAFRVLGGIEGALASRADTILTTYYTIQQQKDLRRLLLRLVQLGDGAPATRRRVPLKDLVSVGDSLGNTQELLGPLIEERLLTTGQDAVTGEEIVELSHEALIQAWPTFTKWLEDAREDLRLQLQLENDVRDWIGHEKNDDYLWGGVRLARIQEWVTRTQPHLNEKDQSFLKACYERNEALERQKEATFQRELKQTKARADEQARSAKRLRGLLVLAAILFLVAVYAALRAHWTAESERLAHNLAYIRALIAFAAVESTQHNDASGSLQLLLAREAYQASSAICATGKLDIYLALLQAIDSAPPWDMTLPPAHHTKEILTVSFSPDGKTILTSSADGTARLWDAESGQQVQQFLGHTGPVRSAYFSPDGKMIVTTGDDRSIRVWDTENGKLRQEINNVPEINLGIFSPDQSTILTVHTDGIARLWKVEEGEEVRKLKKVGEFNVNAGEIHWGAFSPDGQIVATANNDGTVRLWDVKKKQEIHKLTGNTSVDISIFTVAFSPDGNILASAGNDKIIRLWNVESGEQVGKFEGHSERVFFVTFSPDGNSLLSTSYERMILWDVANKQPIHQMSGHTSQIWSASFSLDGQRFITGGMDMSIRLWNARNGTLIRHLSGHTSDVRTIGFSPEGNTIVTAGSDQTIRVWDISSGRQIQYMIGHTGDIRAVAFSPNGSLIVSAGDDETARIWDIQSGRTLHTLNGHIGTIWSVAFSPDGKSVISGGVDSIVRIWDVENGIEVGQLAGYGAQIFSVSFSPNGEKIVIAGADNTAWLWDAESLELLGRLVGHTGSIWSVAFSPDGKTLATASDDETVWIWDMESLQLIGKLVGHMDSVRSVAFSPDGKIVITGSADERARIWDMETLQPVRWLVGHEGGLWATAFSPDGTKIATASADATVRLWNPQTSQQILKLTNHKDKVRAAAFNYDGSIIITVSDDRIIRTWNAATGQMINQLQGHTNVIWTVSFSPQDPNVILTASADGTARLWNIKDGTQINEFAGHANNVRAAIFSPDGNYIITAGDDKVALLRNLANGQIIRTFEGHTGSIAAIAVSPDSEFILTGSDDRSAKLWNLRTGKEVFSLKGHTANLTSVVFSPDGKTIATASEDRTIRLWRSENGEPINSLTGHSGTVYSVAFSPDGKYLVSTSSDLTAKLWTVEDGTEIRSFTGHSHWVRSGVFSPDGTTVITTSDDWTAQTWIVSIDKLYELAGTLIQRDPAIFTLEELTRFSIESTFTANALTLYAQDSPCR